MKNFYIKDNIPSRYWEPEPPDDYVLPEEEWIPDDMEIPFQDFMEEEENFKEDSYDKRTV